MTNTSDRWTDESVVWYRGVTSWAMETKEDASAALWAGPEMIPGTGADAEGKYVVI